MFRFIAFGKLHRAIWRGFQHGMISVAKAAAYSSILTLFPAFFVIAWLLAETHTAKELTTQVSLAVGHVLPPGSRAIALDYFQKSPRRSKGELYPAVFVMLGAASGVMVSWMEGFRRAYSAENTWGFFYERAVAFFLVFLGFIPMAFALGLVAFGNIIQGWLALHLHPDVHYWLVISWTAARWLIASLTSITVIMLIYHWAMPRVQPWHRVLPGAVLATMLWFPFTIGFGYYVTNYATYNLIYGPLAAAIALLVWLYVLSIIVLIGAEYNALICPREERGKRRRR